MQSACSIDFSLCDSACTTAGREKLRLKSKLLSLAYM